MSPLVLNLLLFVLTAAAGFTLYHAVWHPRAPVAERLAGNTEVKRRLSGGLSAVVQQVIDRWPAGRPVTGPIERKLSGTLTYAGFRGPRSAAAFHLGRGTLMIGLSLIGIALAASLGKSVVGISTLGCFVGYMVPTYTIRRIAKARQRRIKTELPDVLALLVVSLEAGVGLSEAIKLVGREVERQGRIMGQELSATAAHMSAGRTLEDSLKDLGERTGVDEVKALAALAIQSHQAGAQIAPALRASAELLNSQRRLAAEEAAHKAAVKMLIPLVFLILPAMLLVVLGPAGLKMFRMFTQLR
ncbi:MAG: type II secretion system F family protein [Deltaproteobacteria bacterium]|nr:type II secretion system F family protein [Deltaproteobacteria bacterium]